MRACHILALAGCTWLTLGATASADVQISIHDGQVSIAAKDATIRQILSEWARVGRTKIVNVERIPGAPMTIELKDVPEKDALDLLLRSVSGYMAAPRAPFVSDASLFDRIIVIPSIAAPTPASSAPPAFSPTGGIPQMLSQDEDDRPVVQPGRGAVLTTFQQPQVGNPLRQNVPAGAIAPPQLPQVQFQQSPPNMIAPPMPVLSSPAQVPTAQPSAPLGAVPTPGMIAAPAQQPGLVIPQNAQPRRSPNEL